MISLRSASSGAWSEKREPDRLGLGRLGGRSRAPSRRCDTVVWRCEPTHVRGVRLVGRRTALQFIIGSPIPMKTMWCDAAVDAPEAAAPGRAISTRLKVAAEPHRRRWRRTSTSAGSPTASLGTTSAARRGSASSRPRPATVGGVEQGLDGAVARLGLLGDESVENETRSSSERAGRRDVRHVLVAGRAPRRSTPRPAGAERGLPRSSSVRCRRSRSITCEGRGDAPREVPRSRRDRLAPPRGGPRPRGPGRFSIGGVTVRDPARDVDERSGVAIDGKGDHRRRAPRGLGAEQARRRRVHREGHPRAPHGRRPRLAGSGAALSGRAPRRGHDGPHPAHERRRPRQPPHAPVLRGAQDLPREGASHRSREGALQRCAIGVDARGRHDRPGARPSPARRPARHYDPRGRASARSAACATRSATR